MAGEASSWQDAAALTLTHMMLSDGAWSPSATVDENVQNKQNIPFCIVAWHDTRPPSYEINRE